MSPAIKFSDNDIIIVVEVVDLCRLYAHRGQTFAIKLAKSCLTVINIGIRFRLR